MPCHSASTDEAIATFRSSSIGNLRSSVWLENELLPYVGIIGAAKEFLPTHLHSYCGSGIDCLQSPNQLSRYLCYLAGRPIETYVELGVLRGGSFVLTVEYLSRFKPIRRACAIDLAICQPLRVYARSNPAVELLGDNTGEKHVAADLRSVTWTLRSLMRTKPSKAASRIIEGWWTRPA
jgi:hypothetical protein